jgi:hypothetical protein
VSAPWTIRTVRTGAVVIGLLPTLLGLSSGGASLKVTRLVGNYSLIRAGESKVVYAFASEGCDGANCSALYRTNVSGAPLTQVTLPPVTTSQSVARVVFANPRDGYATVGNYFPSTLYATMNGARTWHKVMSGHDVSYVVTASANEVLVSSVKCVPRSDDCGQYTVRRGSLEATHWVTLPVLWKTGDRPNEDYYGPSLAAYASTVWEQQTDSAQGGGVYLWTSYNQGRTFVRAKKMFPQLVSVAGCSLYPISVTELWAQCPTGMQVSFWHSSNGGASWRSVSQSQFSGTGGGAFDPVNESVAYLDYGGVQVKGNFVRLSDGGRVATTVSELKCTNASLLFTSANNGLAACEKNDTSIQLERTTDGGSRWENVVLP